MAIRAVVFDIGGVLEITPRTGWEEKWEARLHVKPGELPNRHPQQQLCWCSRQRAGALSLC